jgi:hypothetical protein
MKKLEENMRLMDRKNAELTRKNRQLAKVREMALAIDGLRTREQVYQKVVASARDISGVRFVVMVKTDETGENIVAPYYSGIRNNSINAALKNVGFDLKSFLSENSGGGKIKLSLRNSKLASESYNRAQVIVKTSLAELM